LRTHTLQQVIHELHTSIHSI